MSEKLFKEINDIKTKTELGLMECVSGLAIPTIQLSKNVKCECCSSKNVKIKYTVTVEIESVPSGPILCEYDTVYTSNNLEIHCENCNHISIKNCYIDKKVGGDFGVGNGEGLEEFQIRK